MSDKTPTAKDSFIRFIITMCIYIGFLGIIIYGSYEALHNADGFKNEYLKFGIIIIVIITEAVGVHVVINAVRHRVEVGERFIVSNSFGLHSCNADPKHCFKVNGVRLPICARHLGKYGTIFGFVMFGLATYDLNLIMSLGSIIPWNIHLFIFLFLSVFVGVEGGLGKAKVIKQSNKLRCFSGSLTIFGWLFFMFFFGRLFDLF